MNVLLTTDAFPPGAGGSGRSTATLATALARRGHRVRVVVSRSEPLGQTEWDGVPVSEVGVPKHRPGSRERERAFATGLRHALGEEAWDVVHAQHWLSAMASSDASPNLPLVVTVRDYWPVCIWSTMLSGTAPCPGCTYARRVACVGRRRPWLWPLAPFLPPLVGSEIRRRQRLIGEAKAVVAVSHHIERSLNVPHTHVIPNMSSDDEPDHPRPDDAPERYVLFIGKLEPNKAPDRLLPALSRASCDLPLLVAGTGSMQSALEAEAARLGRDVRFLGWVEEQRARGLMQHAEAVLFPSRWQEPLARVLIDGLGVGAVMVVESTGGTEDAIVDGESGLLASEASGLGEALGRVLRDDALAAHLRRGAKTRARDVFSETVVVPRFEALYESVADS